MDRFKRVLIALALGWAGISLGTDTWGRTLDRIVAVVGNKAITLSELEKAYAQDEQPPGGLAAGPGQAALKKPAPREFLERMVENLLIEQEVERQGIKVEPMEVEKAIENQRQKLGLSEENFTFALAREGISLAQYRDKVKRDLIVLRLVGKEVRSEIEISNEELLTYYQQHQADFILPDKIFLEHLLIPWPADAVSASARQAWRRRIADLNLESRSQGPLSELAQALNSQGIPARSGEFGWLIQGEQRREYEEQTRNLKAGEASPPFEMEEGLFLLRVKERITGNAVAFDQAKDKIQEQLYQQEVMEKYEQWLVRLKARSHVEIRLKDEDLASF